MDHFYQNIGGWFDFEDIYREAVVSAADGARFVEMGAFGGKSTAFMAVEIINSGKKIDFFVVDRWIDNCVMDDKLIQCPFEVFERNMKSGGVMGVIQPLQMQSSEAAKRFKDQSLDFVFIDGDHDYAAARQDILVWREKVKSGGVLAGHDIEHEGVSKALKELLSNVERRGMSWVWRKP